MQDRHGGRPAATPLLYHPQPLKPYNAGTYIADALAAFTIGEAKAMSPEDRAYLSAYVDRWSLTLACLQAQNRAELQRRVCEELNAAQARKRAALLSAGLRSRRARALSVPPCPRR
jgi:hypothetical protein